MSLYLAPMAKAIYQRLATASGMAPVFDHVPEGEAPLYILVGEGNARDTGSKTQDHEDGTIVVWIVSTHRGHREIEEQARQIKPHLHRQRLTLDDGLTVFLKWTGTDDQSHEGQDGVIRRRGRMVFDWAGTPAS